MSWDARHKHQKLTFNMRCFLKLNPGLFVHFSSVVILTPKNRRALCNSLGHSASMAMKSVTGKTLTNYYTVIPHTSGRGCKKYAWLGTEFSLKHLITHNRRDSRWFILPTWDQKNHTPTKQQQVANVNLKVAAWGHLNWSGKLGQNYSWSSSTFPGRKCDSVSFIWKLLCIYV